MSRRTAGQVGLAALVAAVVLLIAVTGGRTAPAAEPRSQPDPTELAPASPTVDPAVQRRAEARQARAAARAARTMRLFRRHGCWTGDAAAGAVPTHALVTLPGKQPALVEADVGFGIWLDGDPGVLHAFCP